MAKRKRQKAKKVKKNQRNTAKSSIANFPKKLVSLDALYPSKKQLRRDNVKIYKSRSKNALLFRPGGSNQKRAKLSTQGEHKTSRLTQAGLIDNRILNKKTTVCNKRNKKRVSLFATGQAGSGKKPNSKRIFTKDSKINCRR